MKTIYAVVGDEGIIYVGKTAKPVDVRILGHIRSKSSLGAWIADGNHYETIVLETCQDDGCLRERFWITQCLLAGCPIFNKYGFAPINPPKWYIASRQALEAIEQDRAA